MKVALELLPVSPGARLRCGMQDVGWSDSARARKSARKRERERERERARGRETAREKARERVPEGKESERADQHHGRSWLAPQRLQTVIIMSPLRCTQSSS